MYFEPLHIQYMSLRNKFKMQVAQRTGELVTFGEGNTIARCTSKRHKRARGVMDSYCVFRVRDRECWEVV